MVQIGDDGYSMKWDIAKGELVLFHGKRRVGAWSADDDTDGTSAREKLLAARTNDMLEREQPRTGY